MSREQPISTGNLLGVGQFLSVEWINFRAASPAENGEI